MPVKIRRALNIQAGDQIVVLLENETIRLIPMQQAVQLAQKIVRQYVPKGVSLVDELVKSRQEELKAGD